MVLIKASVEDDLAVRIRGLAARSDRSVAAEVRRALRHWVDSNGAMSDALSRLGDGLSDGVGESGLHGAPTPSLSPPPVLPARNERQRTTVCVHRRPVSSFCRHCDA